MKEIMEYLKVRYCSEKAQGIVEYALILSFVVLVAVALNNDGGLEKKIEETFTFVAGKLKTK